MIGFHSRFWEEKVLVYSVNNIYSVTNIYVNISTWYALFIDQLLP